MTAEVLESDRARLPSAEWMDLHTRRRATYKSKDGEWKKKPEWHRVTVWGEGSVKHLDNHGKKGALIDVLGQNRTCKWTADGLSERQPSIDAHAPLESFRKICVMFDHKILKWGVSYEGHGEGAPHTFFSPIQRRMGKHGLTDVCGVFEGIFGKPACWWAD